ncbi:unnamed protein product, partial [Mesorhabditis belari]|uniref:TGF-beta family profile domain-containing protein n=1 Tax=Mesorhabditis belari TaxID=2138241 RepID=A0AAF3FR21_9BILA
MRLFLLLIVKFCVNSAEDTDSIKLGELLKLDPGARLLAENLTISIPKKFVINGTEVLSNIVFSAKSIDYSSNNKKTEKTNLTTLGPDLSQRDSHSRLEDSIDSTLDPCDDFYKFVCSVTVEPDVYNSTINTITISPEKPMIEIQYYTDPNYKSQLTEGYTFIREIYGFLSKDDVKREFFDGTIKESERKLRNYFAIDRRMAEIDSLFLEDNTTDISVKLPEVSDLITAVNFTRYFEAILPKSVQEKLSLSKMNIRLRNIIFSLLPYLDDRFLDAYNKLNQRIYGVKTKDSTEEDCINASVEVFSDVAGALYIERYFSQKSVDEVSMMVKNIRNSFIEILEETDWMDNKTKAAARLKAERMMEFIGYNPTIFNATSIAEKYELLDYPAPLTMQGISNAITKWSQQPILAGILQPPFFDPKFSRPQNYGSIGVVIGHEITHGFDNYGSQFDELGNKKNWWDAKTLTNYEQMKQCFVEQYGHTKIEPLNIYIDGYKTLGENIADNGGLRSALRGVQKLINEKKIDTENIPIALRKYSPLQIFFMSYAFSWCGNWRNETLLTETLEDTHSPDRARVNVKTRILQSLDHLEPPFINETFFEQNAKLIKYLQERKPPVAPPKEIFETFHIAVSSNANYSRTFLPIPEQGLKRRIVEVKASIIFDKSPIDSPASVEVYTKSKEGRNLFGSGELGHIPTLNNNEQIAKFSPQDFQPLLQKIGSGEIELEILFYFNAKKTTIAQRFDSQTTNIFFEIKTKNLMALKGQELCDLSDGDEGCCLRSMPVDFSLMKNWNFLIAPRAFDIYICTGSCAINNHARDANSDEYIPVSRHQIMKDSFAEDLVPQCCHPTQYDDITLFLHTPSAAVKQIRYENLLVAACGCD